MHLTSITRTSASVPRDAARARLPLVSRAHLMVMTARKLPVVPGATDPRHVFLTAGEVIARYRWGRTKGYEQLRSAAFPRPLAGRYRLDLLMAWEERQLTDAARPPAPGPDGPPPKRHHQRKATA